MSSQTEDRVLPVIERQPGKVVEHAYCTHEYPDGAPDLFTAVCGETVLATGPGEHCEECEKARALAYARGFCATCGGLIGV